MNWSKESNKGKNNVPRLFAVILLTCILFLAGKSICLAVTVTLQWGASAGSTGYKVYYQADSSTQPFQGTEAIQGVSPIDAHSQTSATISGLDPAHAHYFAVTAYNDSGDESTYSNIVSVPELVSPSVSLTSPVENETVSGTVSVNTTPSDNIGVTRVEFYVNGVLQATETTAPYIFSWNTTSLPPGSFSLMAKAYDAAGNVGQSANVNVNVVDDITAPTVILSSPSNNSIVSGTTDIIASANDNLKVARVEFYINGYLLTATNVEPFRYAWNTALFTNGPYTVSARAYDASGNVGQSSDAHITLANNFPAKPADINGDGIVDIADALMALKFAVELVQPTPDQVSRGDVCPIVNGVSDPDGTVDIQDSLYILKLAVGLTSF